MSDFSQSNAASSSPVALLAREMRRAGLTDEVREEKAAAREAKAMKARLASRQVPPYYCVGDEGAEPNRGRKRTFEGRNEPSSRSSSSDENSRSSDSRATQPSRVSIIGLGDGGKSVRLIAEGELAVSATVRERGGGAAPAQRHNRSPAHNSAGCRQWANGPCHRGKERRWSCTSAASQPLARAWQRPHNQKM